MGGDEGRNLSPTAGLSLEDRILLATAYWRTNLTVRQWAPFFGISQSAADRTIDHLGADARRAATQAVP